MERYIYIENILQTIQMLSNILIEALRSYREIIVTNGITVLLSLHKKK